MANYTKLTDFASKDALPTGNAAKIVKGTEIDDEFEALETAVATKSDIASPSFTGVPTAPTAAAGTNTTQLATTAFVGTGIQNSTVSPAFTGTPTAPTAVFGTDTTQLATTEFVQNALAAIYPVGTIYTSTSATNPATTFGFGSWSAYAAGRMLIGAGTNGGQTFTGGDTGGDFAPVLLSHTHTGTTGNQSVNHTHGITITDPGHAHSVPNSGSQNNSFDSGTTVGNDVTGTSGTATTGITATSAGVSADHNHAFTTNAASSGDQTTGNLPPYISVYMWQRTA